MTPLSSTPASGVPPIRSSKRRIRMKHQLIRRFHGATLSVVIILALIGCTGQLPAPTQPPAQAPSPTAEGSAPTEVPVDSTATSPPATNEDVLYQDDFTNPGTGWAEDQFDNYFIGYHEPEYYHVEITGSNYKTTVFQPDKKSFTD